MGVRVLLADDHRLMREGLRRTLGDAGMEVVGEARDGDEAMTLAVQLRPDVVLMDITMPAMDGLTVTRRLRSRAPRTRVVVLTMHDDEDLVERAYEVGAVGYLVKDASGEEVVEAVRRAHATGAARGAGRHGRSAASRAGPGAAGAPQGADPAPVLSEREREVLQLLADGRRPADVAAELFISPKTVRNHLSRIYDKLEVGDRSQAIVTALRHGLIDLPDR